MSKEGTLFIVGVLVLVSPFLGLPITWLSIVLPALGAVTIGIAQMMRKARRVPPQLPLPMQEPSHDSPSPIA